MTPDPRHDAHIWVCPGRQSGHPCINGTRIPVDTAAGYNWATDLTGVLHAYPSLTRDQVLVACWYAGRWGRKRWRKRYGAWAKAAHGALWAGDYDRVPNPPTEHAP